MGLAFIALGTLALMAAIIQHKKALKAIWKGHYFYSNRRSLSLAVAIIVFLIGLSTFIAIILLTPR